MPTCKVTCKGNNQLGKPGEPLTLLEAQFRDEENEPVIGMPVRFDLVKGEGELMASDERTDMVGGVVAEFIPGNMTGRGRIELRYGDNFENMTPFLFSMEEVPEAERRKTETIPLPSFVIPPANRIDAKIETPPIVPDMPLPRTVRHPSGVNVAALAAALAAPHAPKKEKDPHKKRVPIPVLSDPPRIDPKQEEAERAFFTRSAPSGNGPFAITRSKTVPMLIAVMLVALTVPVYAFVKAAGDKPASVPAGLIADCTKASASRVEGNRLVYDDCPLFRK